MADVARKAEQAVKALKKGKAATKRMLASMKKAGKNQPEVSPKAFFEKDYFGLEDGKA